MKNPIENYRTVTVHMLLMAIKQLEERDPDRYAEFMKIYRCMASEFDKVEIEYENMKDRLEMAEAEIDLFRDRADDFGQESTDISAFMEFIDLINTTTPEEKDAG